MAKIEKKAEVHFYDFLYICIVYRGVGTEVMLQGIMPPPRFLWHKLKKNQDDCTRAIQWNVILIFSNFFSNVRITRHVSHKKKQPQKKRKKDFKLTES